MLARWLALLLALGLPVLASAQTPTLVEKVETAPFTAPPDAPLPSPLPLGQQHLVALHLSIFQPTAATYRPEDETIRYYLTADVNISWLHDFSPHLGWEMGMKFGIAQRIAGTWGSFFDRSARDVSFNKSMYPLVNVFWGFRF